MKIHVALAMLSVILGAFRVEQAAAGNAYDFVVHVKNVPDYGYNPEVSADRAGMALKLVRRECPSAQVVGQKTIDNEIYGITSSRLDYVVFVRCV
jgi:hypothetical protein